MWSFTHLLYLNLTLNNKKTECQTCPTITACSYQRRVSDRRINAAKRKETILHHTNNPLKQNGRQHLFQQHL